MGDDKVSIGFVAGLDYRDATLLGPRRAPAAEDAPVRAGMHRGRQARGAGARRRSPRAATGRCPTALGPRPVPRAATAPAWSTCRSSRASTTPCTPACSPPRRSSRPQGRRRLRRPLRLRADGCEARRSSRTCTARATCASRSRAASSWAARSRTRWRSRAGASPAGAGRTHDDATVDVFVGPSAATRSPTASATFDKLSLGLRHRQRHPRRRAQPHPHPGEGAARRWRSMWQNMCPAQVYEVPDEELEARQRQRQARRLARGQAADHPLELRAVRGDHGEGRPPHPARGRRRPELPGHLRVRSRDCARRRYFVTFAGACRGGVDLGMALKHRLSGCQLLVLRPRASQEPRSRRPRGPARAPDFAGMESSRSTRCSSRSGRTGPPCRRPSGSPCLTTAGWSRAARHARPRCAAFAVTRGRGCFPCDQRGKPLGAGVEGTARVLEDAGDCERAEAALDRHYGRIRRMYEKVMAPEDSMVYLEVAAAPPQSD